MHLVFLIVRPAGVAEVLGPIQTFKADFTPVRVLCAASRVAIVVRDITATILCRLWVELTMGVGSTTSSIAYIWLVQDMRAAGTAQWLGLRCLKQSQSLNGWMHLSCGVPYAMCVPWLLSFTAGAVVCR
jgi:hypothetical protein